MNKGGFSWKRVTGITRVKSSISRTTGVPLTKSGRQRKIGGAVTGGGCLLNAALIITLISLIIISFSFISCLKIENSATKTNTENKLKINDYDNRLKEFSQFMLDYANSTAKTGQDIVDLDDKRVEAAKIKDYEKTKAYYQMEMDKIEEEINSLSKIYVPKIAKKYYGYVLDGITKYKQCLSYVFTTNNNYDESKAYSLKDEADTAFIKADKELEQIKKEFNQEAQELGLKKPFPNIN
jgi:hypothetical protein